VSRAQRLSFLAIAAVIAIVAVILLSGGSGDDEPASTSAKATPTPAATRPAEPEATDAATPTPTPTATPEPQPPLLSAGKVTKLRFKQGETIRFRVRSDVPEEIHVHVYDVTRAIEPGKTANVSFPAEVTGIFEIELHGSGEQIGQLRVDPE
jgi:pyruvate/2-oxoglutarate dehydrogenase complex dihydrolipoamide acyltransferase (E2) component